MNGTATGHEMGVATNAPDVTVGTGGESDGARQDIRLAVVLNGGVSLAIWISGVTLELYHLAMASRTRAGAYYPLLELLRATARIDVIAGTSAGGLNGTFLALGLARNRELADLRNLWRDDGSLSKMLRHPLQKSPPSLLSGDDYFLPRVRGALAAMLEQRPAGSAAPLQHPIELILTGTLWQGRTTSFADDLGAAITEMDHDARFRFVLTGSMEDDLKLVDQLAAAARCTSSFPGAFEPHFVDVTGGTAAGDGPWASSAGLANFRDSQYLLDGGILLNKPIRPALEAIYRQAADVQVRRLLTYVVPDPGEPHLAIDTQSAAGRAIPTARDVLLGVLTRLRSTDSVSRELAEIRTRNGDAHQRRRIRDRLAAVMVSSAELLAGQAWQGYIEVRIGHAARTIGRLVAAGQPAAFSAMSGRVPGRWSESELVDTLRKVLTARWQEEIPGEVPDLFFIPRGELEDAVQRSGDNWDWGATTVQRLGDMTADVLKRAVWLAPIESSWQREIVAARSKLSGTLATIRADRGLLNDYWSTAPTSDPSIPERRDDLGGIGPATSAATEQLEKWLGRVLDNWDSQPSPEQGPTGRRERLYQQALDTANALLSCASAIKAVASPPDRAHHAGDAEREALHRSQAAVDPEGVERNRLAALHQYLLTEGPKGAAKTPNPEVVLARMLRLDVVQLAFAGSSQDVEQEVELVQLSAREPQALTGVQLHHFGAFYRSSWRVNDWLHGRMDAAVHLTRMLLSTERLRQRAAEMVAAPDVPAAQRLFETMYRAAVPADEFEHDQEWLAAQWDKSCGECMSFLQEILRADASMPPAGAQASAEATPDQSAQLKTCVDAIVRPIHTRILREERPALAEAIRAEGEDCAETSRAWLAAYDTVAATGHLTAEHLWGLWERAKRIGRERIAGEVGTDTFARTTAHSAAVAMNTVGASSSPKAVTAVLAALRGYTLAVWAMVTLLTNRSQFGARVVELAVASGGVLLAVAILVPAIPVGFTLAGVLLLLAGLSVAGLLTKEARVVGRRLLAALLLAAAAVAAYVYWDVKRNGLSGTVWSLLVKIGIGLLLVLLGWWIARAQGPVTQKRSSNRRQC
jgi:patatin-related protein